MFLGGIESDQLHEMGERLLRINCVCSLANRKSSGRKMNVFDQAFSSFTKALPLSLKISIFLAHEFNNVLYYTRFKVSFDKPKKTRKKVRDLSDKDFFEILAKQWQQQNNAEVILYRLRNVKEMDALILPANLVLRLKFF